MKELDDEIKNLIAAVKKSKTYLEYEKQLNILKDEPELKAQVDAYREENFKLQNSIDDESIAERMEAFSEKYADFVEESKVSAFLDAELNLCRLMQELTREVVENLNFE